jgi:PBSX family phage terminase large subunit
MAMMRTKGFKFAPFSRKQKQVLTWWVPTSPVKDSDGIIADGAIRSGKTLTMSLSFVMWAMASFNAQNFGMCGKTIMSFRRNVLFWLKIMLRGRGYRVTEHRTENLVIVRRGGNENYFYMFGGRDERSQDLIQGITLAGLLLDEVALMPESFVNQATARCSVEGSKYWFNCNPGGPFHWFKLNWVDKVREKNLLYLRFSMDDNLSLSENVKRRYRAQYTGVFFKRYILGLWVVADGIIYDMFDRDKHVVPARPDSEYTEWHVSVDYGTQNPCVFGLWGKHGNVWQLVREYHHDGRTSGRQKTDEDYCDDLEDFTVGIPVRSVVIDPSAASFIAALKRRGRFVIRKARNSVLDGIRDVGTAILTGLIQFCEGNDHTFQEFGAYAWDPKAMQRGEDKPLKENDHCMDMVRYFVETVVMRPKGLSILK